MDAISKNRNNNIFLAISSLDRAILLFIVSKQMPNLNLDNISDGVSASLQSNLFQYNGSDLE